MKISTGSISDVHR